MSYLLDTNACIAIINGKPAPVRSRLERETRADVRIFLSSIVTFELWYGVSKSSREEFNSKRLGTFLGGPIHLLPFEDDDARSAGALRGELERSGKPIGAYDVLIAGQALNRRLTLVTSNEREFARVKGLSWEDWAKP